MSLIPIAYVLFLFWRFLMADGVHWHASTISVQSQRVRLRSLLGTKLDLRDGVTIYVKIVFYCTCS